MIDISLPVRAVQILFAVISLGLIGYGKTTPFALLFGSSPHLLILLTVSHWYNDKSSYRSSPPRVSFLIFVSLWTLIVAPLLAAGPRFFPRIINKFVILGLDALTWVFWLAGWAALAAFRKNLILCIGRTCNTMTAEIVFGVFEWSVVSLILLHPRACSVLKTRVRPGCHFVAFQKRFYMN